MIGQEPLCRFDVLQKAIFVRKSARLSGGLLLWVSWRAESLRSPLDGSSVESLMGKNCVISGNG